MTFTNSREVDWCPSPYGKRCVTKCIAFRYKQGNKYHIVALNSVRSRSPFDLCRAFPNPSRSSLPILTGCAAINDVILSTNDGGQTSSREKRFRCDSSLAAPVVYTLEIARRSINTLCARRHKLFRRFVSTRNVSTNRYRLRNVFIRPPTGKNVCLETKNYSFRPVIRFEQITSRSNHSVR